MCRICCFFVFVCLFWGLLSRLAINWRPWVFHKLSKSFLEHVWSSADRNFGTLKDWLCWIHGYVDVWCFNLETDRIVMNTRNTDDQWIWLIWKCVVINDLPWQTQEQPLSIPHHIWGQLLLSLAKRSSESFQPSNHPCHHRIINPHIDLEMCDRRILWSQWCLPNDVQNLKCHAMNSTWLRNAMLPSECISFRLPSTFTGANLSEEAGSCTLFVSHRCFLLFQYAVLCW